MPIDVMSESDVADRQLVGTLFDEAWYLKINPDVAAAAPDALGHFLAYGWREGRRPNRYFDKSWYLATHPVPNSMNPLLHYVLFGEPHGFAPGRSFDPMAYRQRVALGPTHCLLAHFLRANAAPASLSA